MRAASSGSLRDHLTGYARVSTPGFIRDRQRAGIDAAKANGIYKGRLVTFDRARIVSLRKEGMGASEITKAVGCKRGNVYKTLKAAGFN
jgi:DNA invertase Pin-like site-specific DNA recombinase